MSEQYEYDIISGDMLMVVIQRMNEMVREGWEPISLASCTDSVEVLLRRKV